MLRNSFNILFFSPGPNEGGNEGRAAKVPNPGPPLTSLFLVAAIVAATPTYARKKEPKNFAPTIAEAAVSAPANGSIFRGNYTPLTSGARASQVGDIVTIILVERTSASKSNSASTDRTGNVGLTPPKTGILNALKPSDLSMSGDQSFKGKGDTSQSNALSGEVSVTVVATYPNGSMLVRGEKQLTLNRGDEHVQISGLIRSADISPDNRISSTHVADARIRYIGRGEIARASKQGWLQRFFSKISPF